MFGPSTKTALNASRTPASGCVEGIIAGWTRTAIRSSSPISAIASSFTMYPSRRANSMSSVVTPSMPSR